MCSAALSTYTVQRSTCAHTVCGGDPVGWVSGLQNGDHKVHTRIHKEYHSVCPLVGIGTLPTHLTQASVPLPQ